MTKYSDKIIFIPARLKKVSFKWFPVSDFLVSYLKQNNLNTISDLQKIKGENLEKILESTMKPFPELRHYILAFQENSNAEIKLLTFERKDKENDEDTKTPDYLSQTVFVPLAARRWEISHLPITESLIANLKKCGYKTLDDLHGSVYSRFTDVRFFEKNDSIDLYFFVSQLKSDEVLRFVEENITKLQEKNETVDRLPPMLRKKINKLKADFRENESVGQLSSVDSNNQIDSSDDRNQDISSITDKAETIETPASLRALPIEHLAPSEKLNAAFKKEKFMFVGQFDGWLYSGLEKKLKLRKSETNELRRLFWFARKYSRYTVFKSGFENIKKAAEKHKENVEKMLAASNKIGRKIPASSNLSMQSSSVEKFVVPSTSRQKFIVPLQLKKVPLSEFDLSIKLNGMLSKLGIEFVGNLGKISFEDFTKAPLCTWKVTEEFREFLFQLEDFEVKEVKSLAMKPGVSNEITNAAQLMKFVNDFLLDLPPRDMEIFLNRFGGASDEQILTFEKIAAKHEIRQESAYQIYVKILNKLEDALNGRTALAKKKLYDECLQAICPLTVKFLVDLVENDYELFQFPAAFYVRLFGFLFPELPIMPDIENKTGNLKSGAKKVERQIIEYLGNSELPVTLAEVFNKSVIFNSDKENNVGDFFQAVQSVKFNLITTENPRELFIESNETT